MSSSLDAARPLAVPAGTPHLRPAVHYTAQQTWLNDPNGLVYFRGRYHLYYQNNPYGCVWGNMSWGHASSTDLVHWTEHPMAIACDETEDIYSGSVVVDHSNSSGFGAGENAPLVAIYTSAFKSGTPHSGTQAQSLAYSNDGGMTWAKYSGNPVLTRGSANFRDPKVFRYSGPHGAWWVMAAVEAQQNKVVLYRSPDLKAWEYASEFGRANAIGGEWECPDPFPLAVDGDPARTKWVMVVNINPGAVAGGSGGQYFVGDFDGVRFTADPSSLAEMGDEIPDVALRSCRWLDWGRDYYAAVSFSDAPDNRRIMIGWMNTWDYANSLPTAPWRSGMSLAREVRLATVDGRPALVQNPILPDGAASGIVHAVESMDVRDAMLRLPDAVPRTAQLIDAEFLPGTARNLGFRLLGDAVGSAATLLRYDPATGELILDRRSSGATDFHAKFPSTESAPVALDDGVLTLRIVVDQCSVEVFAQDGRVVSTDLVFPNAGNLAMSLFVGGGAATIRQLQVRNLC